MAKSDRSVTLSVRIAPETERQLRAAAAAAGEPFADWVRRTLTAAVDWQDATMGDRRALRVMA